ncbi:MAG: hypothetical protein AB7N76_16810 [Planctomycetota bacterium]
MRLRSLTLLAALLLLGCPGPPAKSSQQAPAAAAAGQLVAKSLRDRAWARTALGEAAGAEPVAVGLSVPGPGALRLRFLERERVIWEQVVPLEISGEAEVQLAIGARRVQAAAAKSLDGAAAEASRPTSYHFDLAVEPAPGKLVRHGFDLEQPDDADLASAGIGLGTPKLPSLSAPPRSDLWLWTVVHAPKAKLLLLGKLQADAERGEPRVAPGEGETKPLAAYPAPIWQLVARYEPK